VKKIDLAGGEGGVQEMTGRAVVVPGKILFYVKEIYDEDSRQENKQESQIKETLISFAHMLTNKYIKKPLNSQAQKASLTPPKAEKPGVP